MALRRIGLLTCIISMCLAGAILIVARQATRAAGGGQGPWIPVTGKAGRGPKGSNTITLLRVRQDNGDVIVGLASGGLWKSSNGGVTRAECGREKRGIIPVFHM